MPISRRVVLFGLGVIVIGLATAGTTGAFDEVSFERPLHVDVGTDAEGYLQVEPHADRTHEPGLGVEVNADGLVEINLTKANLNDDGLTSFDNLLNLTNRGSKPVLLDLSAVDSTGATVDGVLAYDTDLKYSEVGMLASDGSVSVGLQFDSSKDLSNVVSLEFKATS